MSLALLELVCRILDEHLRHVERLMPPTNIPPASIFPGLGGDALRSKKGCSLGRPAGQIPLPHGLPTCKHSGINAVLHGGE